MAVYDSVMGNAQNKIVFHTEHPEDLRTLAQMLFMGVFDPDKIQFALESTKIIAYREETRTIRHESETDAVSIGTHSADIVGSGGGAMTVFDAEGNPTTAETSQHSEAHTSGSSAGRSKSKTGGTSQVPFQAPVFGKEVSSVQPDSLENQLHRAMVALWDQQQREFVAKLSDRRTPVSLRTPTVNDTPASEERIGRYVTQVMSNCPFTLPLVDAQKRLADRQENLLKEFLRHDGEEPASAKWRIR